MCPVTRRATSNGTCGAASQQRPTSDLRVTRRRNGSETETDSDFPLVFDRWRICRSQAPLGKPGLAIAKKRRTICRTGAELQLALMGGFAATFRRIPAAASAADCGVASGPEDPPSSLPMNCESDGLAAPQSAWRGTFAERCGSSSSIRASDRRLAAPQVVQVALLPPVPSFDHGLPRCRRLRGSCSRNAAKRTEVQVKTAVEPRKQPE